MKLFTRVFALLMMSGLLLWFAAGPPPVYAQPCCSGCPAICDRCDACTSACNGVCSLCARCNAGFCSPSC